MVFPVAHLVAYLSQHMTLQPGDIILTGTPEGVVLGRPQREWLTFRAMKWWWKWSKLGRLTNRLVSAG
jgi:2-keto-4-pentenoate hydratase/2-oxohepta-3-ene-1,7-dioic acid hydratase in catechol pathway